LFIDEIKRPDKEFVGIDSLVEETNRVSSSFGVPYDCLFLDHGSTQSRKANEALVDKPFAKIKCKYAGCEFLIHFSVEENEQGAHTYKY